MLDVRSLRTLSRSLSAEPDLKRRTFIQSTAIAASARALPRNDAFAGFYRLLTQDPGDLEAVRGDGSKVTLKGAAIKELGASLRGRLLLAKSPGYEEARLILNPSFNKHPALIAQPTGTADVRSAVMFAREHSLLVAVKCGGHSFSGQSTCDGGMMIDLSAFRGVRVDPKARRAWVAGGTLLGQVDHETRVHGLVTTLGTVSHTGVGGLTTGGGFGRLARRFGLALDNVVGVEVVTADGSIHQANKDENPDLFWGVRGGGGNFGVVTSFEFELHPMQRQVVGGMLRFPYAKARDVLSLYADYSLEAPDELYLDFFMQIPPGGAEGAVGLTACYSGPEASAARVFEPLRRLGTPLDDGFKTIDYVAIQRSGDITDPRAVATYLKTGFTAQISTELINAIMKGFQGHPARMTQVFTAHCGGAIGRVAPEATAFAHRYARQALMAAVSWKTGDDPAEHIRWARQNWATLEPFTRGFYTNDVGEQSAAAVNANYLGNHPRLVALKNKYDPTNLFRLNANVVPTV